MCCRVLVHELRDIYAYDINMLLSCGWGREREERGCGRPVDEDIPTINTTPINNGPIIRSPANK
jgi:hypothetical protein